MMLKKQVKSGSNSEPSFHKIESRKNIWVFPIEETWLEFVNV